MHYNSISRLNGAALVSRRRAAWCHVAVGVHKYRHTHTHTHQPAKGPHTSLIGPIDLDCTHATTTKLAIKTNTQLVYELPLLCGRYRRRRFFIHSLNVYYAEAAWVKNTQDKTYKITDRQTCYIQYIKKLHNQVTLTVFSLYVCLFICLSAYEQNNSTKLSESMSIHHFSADVSGRRYNLYIVYSFITAIRSVDILLCWEHLRSRRYIKISMAPKFKEESRDPSYAVWG